MCINQLRQLIALWLVPTAFFLTISQRAWAQPVLPDFSLAVFDNPLQIDNPYFPLVPGTVYTYQGEATDPDTGVNEMETIIVEVLHDVRSVAGVDSRVVRDRVFVDGLVIEDTFDWYAQDNAGNVWYMGEDVTDFEYDDAGNVIGTSSPGAWEAAVDGARPGHLMRANPQVGDQYYQEFFAGEAEDEALVLALGQTHTVPFGTFADVLRTRDTTALEPDALAHKFYAPGVGPILENSLDVETGAILGTVQLVSVVPEPSTCWLLTIAVTGLLHRSSAMRRTMTRHSRNLATPRSAPGLSGHTLGTGS